MNLNALANLGQIVDAIGVMITLIYLAVQIRGNTRVASAQARHALSEFVLRISIFRAEHADRFARLESREELTDGDRQFQYWSHVQFLLHAETYFHHHELGLMPDASVCAIYDELHAIAWVQRSMAQAFRKTSRVGLMASLV